MPYRLVGAAHLVVAFVLFPLCFFFGLAAAPVIAVVPLWLAFLGVKLWRGPSARETHLLRASHAGAALLAGALTLAGISMLLAANRNPVHSDVSIARYGFLPVAVGCLIGMLATITLMILRHQPRA